MSLLKCPCKLLQLAPTEQPQLFSDGFFFFLNFLLLKLQIPSISTQNDSKHISHLALAKWLKFRSKTALSWRSSRVAKNSGMYKLVLKHNRQREV